MESTQRVALGMGMVILYKPATHSTYFIFPLMKGFEKKSSSVFKHFKLSYQNIGKIAMDKFYRHFLCASLINYS
jgi:hypothetical protein